MEINFLNVYEIHKLFLAVNITSRTPLPGTVVVIKVASLFQVK